MVMKLEVAEERQKMVRCGGANEDPALRAATSAIGGGLWRGFACKGEGNVLACIEMKRAYTDAAADKPGVQIGTPHLDRLLPPLFDVS